jgi:hypothetical protein
MSSEIYQNDNILLKCVKEGSKLRVKIITPGYYNEANCQFPRDIRKEGAVYEVHKNYINLITTRGKYFYSIRSKNYIKILNDSGIKLTEEQLKTITIFEDTSLTDCAVCYDNPKDSVLYPCGHFYTCSGCSKQLKKCPVCRSDITNIINKADMD